MPISNLIRALLNSLNGFRLTWKKERAFQLEVIICACVLPLIFFIDGKKTDKLFVVFSLGLVLITELLNTGIEKANDAHKKTPDPLIQFSKDASSAAVFIALCLGGISLLNLWLS
jgi:diacylglycerol kinase (ATP)